MANSIIGIPTTRLSDLFVRDQLLNQLQSNESDLFKIQTQLSTGYRFQSISDDPVAALSVIGLQSLLQRKAQVQSNIDTNQSYLSTTDSALSSVSDLLTQVRATAVGVVGSTATDAQRSAAAQQVEQAIQQLLNTGNQQFRGRYLFSGSENSTAPFQSVGDVVEYAGNEESLSSYQDLNLLFNTNLNGNEVFGAISSQVQGQVKITPDLTYDTPLTDLFQGQGISKGSILVSDGTSTSTIDLSGAKTVGDLAAMIHAHPPAGDELNVDITADKIIIQLVKPGGGNLSIREVGGGTVAQELGIRNDNGVGYNPISSRSLDPTLDGTTSLQNILGAYAGTVLHSTGDDNDIRLRADAMGATTSTGVALNDVSISLVDDPSITAGKEKVDYDPNAHTITVHIAAGYTRAYNVINAINNAHDTTDLPFTADMDPMDDVQGGQGLVEAGVSAVTCDGSGEPLDQQSGLQITNGGQTFNISLSDCKTVEDLLNAVNANPGLLAQINDTKDGINIRSRDSGADFMIGENGGTTAAQLGLRTFTENTPLDDLNYGQGVGKTPDPSTNGATMMTVVKFAVDRADGTQLNIDISNPQTVGDVLNAINNNPANADGKLVARLATSGNGIELVDTSTGSGALTVIPDQSNTAAIDLGLVAAGKANNSSGTFTYSTRLVSTDPVTSLPVPNSAIIVTSDDTSGSLSGAQIVLDATAQGVTYNAANKTLTVGIDPNGNTDADDVVNMINSSDYGSEFHAALDPAGGNDGTGKVVDGISGIMYGAKLTSIDPVTSQPVADSGIIVSAANASDNLNGVQVVLSSTATGVTYDDTTKTLTVGIIPGVTTANNVVTAINTSGYSSMFQASLDPIGGNDGTGYVVDGTSATITSASTLDGSDVDQQETEGIFSALIRLKQALQNNDTAGIERAMGLLDTSTQQLDYAHAELGARQQGLDTMKDRLSSENIELQNVLSNEYDADITQVVSDLAGQQTTFQAALKATASILQMTLLNYL
ncbi:MAG: flagellar hook-associated protein FlgL [Thermoguttaceae bacterium]|jgi:flagellin-like hook-associated protein FlgL